MANELMLRLTYKGEVVGYEEHAYNENLARVTTWYRRENSETWSGVSLLHDSFDLGVQVNGAWVFEGDILTHDGWLLPGVVHRDEAGMWVFRIKGFQDYPLIKLTPVWRVIGNIHEEGNHDNG